jgi:hypothetical protein
MYHSPTNRKLQAGKGTLSENGANSKKGNNKTSSGTGKNTRNKVASITYRQRSKARSTKRTNTQTHRKLETDTKHHHGYARKAVRRQNKGRTQEATRTRISLQPARNAQEQ